MRQKNDPMAEIVLKLALVFITAVIAVYFLSACVSVLGLMPSTGSVLMDVFMFKLIPIFIAFVIIYKIVEIFSR